MTKYPRLYVLCSTSQCMTNSTQSVITKLHRIQVMGSQQEHQVSIVRRVDNKNKVLNVQLGTTLSSVKFVVKWCGLGWRVEGGDKTLDCSSLTLKRPTYQILASCHA